jgi:hypothetical protein
MKIAICFSGLGEGEHVLSGWQSIKEHVYHSDHEYDTYFHAWVERKESEQKLVDTLVPKEYLVEPQQDQVQQSLINSTIQIPYRVLNVKEAITHRVLSQMLSRKKVTQLALETAAKEEIEYDLIVILRYDICFKQHLVYENIHDATNTSISIKWSGCPRKPNKVFDYFWVGPFVLLCLVMKFMHHHSNDVIHDRLIDAIPSLVKAYSDSIYLGEPIIVSIDTIIGVRGKLIHELYIQLIDFFQAGRYKEFNILFEPIMRLGSDYHLNRLARKLPSWDHVFMSVEDDPSQTKMLADKSKIDSGITAGSTRRSLSIE